MDGSDIVRVLLVSDSPQSFSLVPTHGTTTLRPLPPRLPSFGRDFSEVTKF
jgi:hypothetical protein